MRFWQTGIAAALALTIAASAVQAQVEVATVTDGETGASADRKADASSLAVVVIPRVAGVCRDASGRSRDTPQPYSQPYSQPYLNPKP